MVSACKKLMGGPDRTSAYWALLLVNLLGASEPVIMEEAAEQVQSVIANSLEQCVLEEVLLGILHFAKPLLVLCIHYISGSNS